MPHAKRTPGQSGFIATAGARSALILESRGRISMQLTRAIRPRRSRRPPRDRLVRIASKPLHADELLVLIGELPDARGRPAVPLNTGPLPRIHEAAGAVLAAQVVGAARFPHATVSS